MEKVEIFKDLFASKNKDGSRTFTKRDIERPEVINLIRYWTLNGARQQTIYDGLGIPTSTWYKWKDTSNKLASALAMTPDVANSLVVSAALKNATKGDQRAIEFWLRSKDKAFAMRQPLPAETNGNAKVDKIDLLLGTIEDSLDGDSDAEEK